MTRSEKTKLMKGLLREKREEILRIAERHGARNVRVFGSVVHGEATETRDIDLLVDTAEQTSPWFPAGLAAELEELLGQRVDVVTTNGLLVAPPAHLEGSQAIVKTNFRVPKRFKKGGVYCGKVERDITSIGRIAEGFLKGSQGVH
ncbi:MAG TPA: nucleotidyltransferase domain-containing protein [Methylomirabilota bacterium]|nr:nucleotidyltransferase domain-containing protein [Methylomirabilota bacterium]